VHNRRPRIYITFIVSTLRQRHRWYRNTGDAITTGVFTVRFSLRGKESRALPGAS
jgi:hypothetical protein